MAYHETPFINWREERRKLQAEIKVLKEQRDDAKATADRWLKRYEEVCRELNEHKADRESLLQTNSRLEDTFNKLVRERDAYKREAEKAQEAALNHNRSRDEANKLRSAASERSERHLTRAQEAESRLAEMTLERDTWQADAREARRLLARYEGTNVKGLDEENAKLNAECNRRKAECDGLAAALAEAKQDAKDRMAERDISDRTAQEALAKKAGLQRELSELKSKVADPFDGVSIAQAERVLKAARLLGHAWRGSHGHCGGEVIGDRTRMLADICASIWPNET